MSKAVPMKKAVPTIMVWPRDEKIIKVMRHPTGLSFRSIDHGMAWPNDQFTMRRIRDGDILTHAPIAPPAQEPTPVKRKSTEKPSEPPEEKK